MRPKEVWLDPKFCPQDLNYVPGEIFHNVEAEGRFTGDLDGELSFQAVNLRTWSALGCVNGMHHFRLLVVLEVLQYADFDTLFARLRQIHVIPIPRHLANLHEVC